MSHPEQPLLEEDMGSQAQERHRESPKWQHFPVKQNKSVCPSLKWLLEVV